LACAPSYDSFVARSRGEPVGYEAVSGGIADVAEILRAARSIGGAHDAAVVAVDMPLATTSITKRRVADDAVAREFGRRGCSPHTPSAVRPGPISDALRTALESSGFPLATADVPVRTTPALLEVYPHPALLTLLGGSYRTPYKLARVRRYWKGADAATRNANLANEWRRIVEALTRVFGELPLPQLDTVPTSRWKHYEDALDAIVCAWVGTRYIEGAAKAFGDSAAAIWCPL
jgi:predicted RNase H-like nuclease